ncbi:hypothetical protein KP509_22G030100 [Ceratopteris richardii]|nr:hypothetical protein KP509_22G030100 [Ceratopteris richardii]
MVLSTHSSAEVFVQDLQLAVANGDGRWINSYLDNTIKLLDTCIILKAAIAEIKSYCGHLTVALRAVEKDSIGEIQLRRCSKALKNCMDALKRKDDSVNHLGQRRSKLENCSSMLRRMGERLNTENACKGDLFMAMYAAQVITIFVCGLLSSALSFKPRRSLSSICVGGQSSWCFSLSSLQQRVKEQVEKKKSRDSNALLEELDMADIVVRHFHSIVEKGLRGKVYSDKGAQVLKVKEGAKILQNLLLDLLQGIPTLESHVENIYRNLLRSRMVFLDMGLCSQ